MSKLEGRARKDFRMDGYQNLLNKYGTTQDNSESYFYAPEGRVPDMVMTRHYETDGLFAKIIDAPAEESMKKGFNFGIEDDKYETFVRDKLESLNFKESVVTAVKWARLYGGSVILMLIDDGRNLDEPVDWENAKDIDELRVYERAIVQPDYTELYTGYGVEDSIRKNSNFGNPQFFSIFSTTGYFRVHESRLLIFKNGRMPEVGMMAEYRYWGVPEYARIKRELRETVTAHEDGVKLLERSVQPIYKMRNLAQLLATDDGENQALRRLQLIDMARGFLNSIAIDADGEDYNFQTFSTSGVAEIINTTCNMLSAITEIPQTVLFGRSPAGMNSTGDSDMENYYNFVDKIRETMIYHNLQYIVDAISVCGVNQGQFEELPRYKVEFEPLWNMSEQEQAQVDQTKAQTAQTKAYTAQIYIDMGVLEPREVRKGLMGEEEYEIEDLIDEESDEEIMSPEERSSLSQFKMETLTGSGQDQQGMGMPPQMMGGMPNPENPEGQNPMQMMKNEENEQENVIAADDEESESYIEEGEDEVGRFTNRQNPSIIINFDGAPLGNDNAAKDHVKKGEEKTESKTKVRRITKAEIEAKKNAKNEAEGVSEAQEGTEEGSEDNSKGEVSKPENEASERSEKEEDPRKKKGEVETVFQNLKRNNGVISLENPVYFKGSADGKYRGRMISGDIVDVEDFAGKGCKKELYQANGIARDRGGVPEDWVHSKGFVIKPLEDGREQVTELHWIENENFGAFNLKVKKAYIRDNKEE